MIPKIQSLELNKDNSRLTKRGSLTLLAHSAKTLPTQRKGFPSSSLEHPLSTPLSDFRDTPSETPLLTKKENPQAFLLKGSPFENGGYLLSHFYAVPSAWLGLTSLFGMGRGGTPTL